MLLHKRGRRKTWIFIVAAGKGDHTKRVIDRPYEEGERREG